MGRLIPAGTGMAKYQNIGIQIDAPDELIEGPDEETSSDLLPAGGLDAPGEAPGLMAGPADPMGDPSGTVES